MNDSALRSRRKFVKMVAFGTAMSALAGGVWRRTLLADIQIQAATNEATFTILLSDYPALQQAFGSVRLGVNPITPDPNSFPVGDNFPVIINRDDHGKFFAMSSECTHNSCVVPTYDASIPGMLCFCHGSRYDIQGRVLAPPAFKNLTRYTIDFDGNNTLTIHVPNLGFNVSATVLAGANGRFSITFPTFRQVVYELRFRQKVQDPWAVIPFATTPGGTANQTSLTGDLQTVTIYVDRANTAGIYAVAMQMLDLT